MVAAAVALVTRVLGVDGARDGGFAEADPTDAATVPVPDDYRRGGLQPAAGPGAVLFGCDGPFLAWGPRWFTEGAVG